MWAAAYGSREGVPYDPELLFVGAMLHDIGLVPEFDSQIVGFELALNSAQQSDFLAGSLSTKGANGGAQFLSTQPYYPGINDSLGGDPEGNPFNPTVFTAMTR